jgi:excisionase family DNA binding protein
MPDTLLTISDVSEHLRLKPKTIHQLVRDGKMSCVQVTPRERRFLPTQIQEFIQSRIIEAPKTVDSSAPSNVPFQPKPLRKGVDGSQGVSRAELLAEVRSWQ